jgi:hypothetical protein
MGFVEGMSILIKLIDVFGVINVWQRYGLLLLQVLSAVHYPTLLQTARLIKQ